MPLIQLLSRCVWQHSHGRSFEERWEASKPMSRKMGGVKAHVLYDIEAQVPAFYTVTTASKHDSTAMSSVSCEPNAYYVFDRAYDSFKELYRIHLTESFFVVRAKTNLKYKIVKWKRRMPKNVLTHLSALDVANLYQKRWLVELFFKWLKQHLKIKRFWGTTDTVSWLLSNMICD